MTPYAIGDVTELYVRDKAVEYMEAEKLYSSRRYRSSVFFYRYGNRT